MIREDDKDNEKQKEKDDIQALNEELEQDNLEQDTPQQLKNRWLMMDMKWSSLGTMARTTKNMTYEWLTRNNRNKWNKTT